MRRNCWKRRFGPNERHAGDMKLCVMWKHAFAICVTFQINMSSLRYSRRKQHEEMEREIVASITEMNRDTFDAEHLSRLILEFFKKAGVIQYLLAPVPVFWAGKMVVSDSILFVIPVLISSIFRLKF